MARLQVHQQKVQQQNNFFFQKKLLAVVCSLAMSSIALAQDAKKEDEAEEIVITARQQALLNAIERKQKAESSIDSVVADDAGQLPDASLAEVLQRVSGVSVVRFSSLGDPDHFASEGTGVQVRGLSGVAGRLNGREVFSSSNGRGLSWGDVPPELMAAVDIYKTPTADLIEGGTGGQIDLRTKMPFDYKEEGLKGAITANYNYSDLAKEHTPGASMLLSNRWSSDLGEFGVLVDLSQSKLKQSNHFLRMEPYYKKKIGQNERYIPGGFTYGVDSLDRDRSGAYLALQYAPNDDLKFGQTFFYSNYEQMGEGYGRFVTSKDLVVNPDNLGASKFDSNGMLVSSTDMFVQNNTTFGAATNQVLNAGGNTGASISGSETFDASTTFEWTPTEKWAIKGAVQAVNSTGDRKNYDVFSKAPFPARFGLDLTGDFPQITMPASASAPQQDWKNYTWDATQDHLEHSDGKLRAINVDASYAISEEAFFRSVQFGARLADRDEVDDATGYNWKGLSQGWNGRPVQNFADNNFFGDIELQTFNDFFRGEAKLPGATYGPSLRMVRQMNPFADHKKYGPNVANAGTPYTYDDFSRLTASQTNTSAYVLTRFSDEVQDIPFSGNIGLRYVKFDSESKGFYRQNAFSLRETVNAQLGNVLLAGPLLGAPRTAETTFNKLLPSINVKLQPTEEFNIRLAYNTTLDQASFNAMRVTGSTSASIDTTTNDFRFTTTSGNPYLKPVISNNTDVSFEWYPSRSLSGHVSLFHKSIDNWLIYTSVAQPIPLTTTVPKAETIQVMGSKDDVTNSSETAKVKGIEIGGRGFFTFLPQPWDGFGVEANYTYIDSQNPGDRYIDINGKIKFDVPLQGLSENTANLTFMFEKGPISWRLAYSWRDKYLMSTSSNGTNGDYRYYSAANTPVGGQFVDISLPVYGGDYGQLDMGATYKFSSQLSASLELTNLTNEINKTWMGGYPNNALAIRTWGVSDRRTNLVVKYNF
jgi:iron complex outermembrane receptor protein